MKIALQTDSIEAHSPGFRNYVRGLVHGLDELPGEHEYTLVHRAAHEFYDGRRHEIVPHQGRIQLVRQLRLAAWLGRRDFEVVHDTYHFGPFLAPGRFARVLTIGDLTPLVTASHPASQRIAHLTLVRLIALRAHRIVTFSESSKRDISRIYRIPPRCIAVTQLAADRRFCPMAPDEVTLARDRLALPERFLVHVGTIEPRKNIERLVRAYAAALPHIDQVPLLLVGREGWKMGALGALIRGLGLEGRVIRRDDIANDDLPAVYNAALALIYPSLYEGFGLPPLEAMQCGTAVVTSNVTSLPEVVGDAAMTIDPESIHAIAGALVAVVNEPSLRLRLGSAGIRRAARFTWRRCAEQTVAAYEEASRVAHGLHRTALGGASR